MNIDQLTKIATVLKNRNLNYDALMNLSEQIQHLVVEGTKLSRNAPNKGQILDCLASTAETAELLEELAEAIG